MTTAAKRDEQFEMMLFVLNAKCWLQQQTDGTKKWAAQGAIHPCIQLDPVFADSPGAALNAAYTEWKRQNT